MDKNRVATKHMRWLLELTALPTAAGREDRVIRWVTAWARRRRNVVLRRDRVGNMELRRRGRTARRPIYFTAHMDHPAFVVHRMSDRQRLIAEFRGGVDESYFVGAKVLLHTARGEPPRGTVRCHADDAADTVGRLWQIHFPRPVKAEPGQVLTWDVGTATVRGGHLHAPACDDLAGVAAAVCAFDVLLAAKNSAGSDVRLLLTRAEEVGFVGAIAAARSGAIPSGARLVTLENSKSFAESPIGAGPVMRVGDRTTIFDPDLTYRIGILAGELARRDNTFRWQRRLMPGGTCEATALQAYGYSATCLCLPLGNYHNMNERTGRIAAETISLADFRDLVRLLVEVATGLDDSSIAPSLRERLENIYNERRCVLRPSKR